MIPTQKKLIRHGENGYLFEIDNYEELADLLNKYKSNDPVCKYAQDFAKQFRENIIGEKLLNLYN